MKKITILMLSSGLMAFAGGKHYSVCIHGGGDYQCSKPLTKDVADATAYVLSMAPIGGLDYVEVLDLKKVKDQPKQVPTAPPPADKVRYENNI
jgi:hypothetical protein